MRGSVSWLETLWVDRFFRFGLAWSAVKKGHILGSSEDMTVCHWYASRFGAILLSNLNLFFRDVNAYSKGKSLEPVAVYQGHDSVVGVRLLN